MIKHIRILSLFFISAQIAAMAATVELKDGRQYQATEITKDELSYTMVIDGARVQFPKTMVVKIDQAEAASASVAVTPPAPVQTPLIREDTKPVTVIRKTDAPLVKEVVVLEAEAPLEIQLPLPKDEEVMKRLTYAVDALRSSADRAAARDTIAAAGEEGLAVLVHHGLYHASPTVRTQSAMLLSRLGGRSVLKHLIEAFHAAAAPTIPPYQVDYVEALAIEISSMAGEDFTFFVRRSTAAPKMASSMAVWWQKNSDTLPPQLGEPKLDPTDTRYVAKLSQLRTLTLQRHNFVGSNHSPELAGPPLPPTAAERLFLETVPTLPRDQLYHREVNTSFTPGVDKVPGEGRDYPGRWRQEQYKERLRQQSPR